MENSTCSFANSISRRGKIQSVYYLSPGYSCLHLWQMKALLRVSAGSRNSHPPPLQLGSVCDRSLPCKRALKLLQKTRGMSCLFAFTPKILPAR
ncbi:hypothetical protein CEXT_140041 [Caerostris extrusa]|uniref:Uncharacterized protein n=1 Tax=Caerostris extrusa TaxID=172846 RepID=A0AAV4Q7C2_CAEEX|nr:hypothetical protein CEXT_140041 [Caerostris extrusa]